MNMEDIVVDDLQLKGLKIFQYNMGFKFGTDAVLLSDFAKDVCKKNVIDLCTGSGIIPILLSAKTNANNIVGVEIQEKIASLAQKSIEMNNLENKIQIINSDVNDLKLTRHSFDTVTCNPPYMKCNSAIQNELDSKKISRHEVMITFDDCARITSELLIDKGHFVVVHRPNRLCDVVCSMRKYNLEPKRIRFVHSNKNSAPSMFLIDATMHGGNELKVLPPLYLYDENGETDEFKRIYDKVHEKK